MTTTDPTPYTPTDDEVRVLAQWIAQAASDWIDVESDDHEHGLACTNWEAYVGDAHDALVDLDARAPEPRAARDARVRAEAVRDEYERHLLLAFVHRNAGRMAAGDAEAKIASAYKEDADRLARAAAIEQETQS